MKKFAVLVMLGIVLGPMAVGAPVLDTKRTGAIKGPISYGALPFSQGLIKFGLESTEPVAIIIDSPGGSIAAGNLIINAIDHLKSKGIDVNCYVTGMAVSMAFQILLHCTNRYALPYSQFLWHGARTQIREPITTTLALDLAKSLTYVDEILTRDMLLTLRGDTKAIMEHHRLETMHLADQVNDLAPGFLQVDNSLQNAPDLALSGEILTSEVRMPFFMRLFRANEIVYMYNYK